MLCVRVAVRMDSASHGRGVQGRRYFGRTTASSFPDEPPSPSLSRQSAGRAVFGVHAAVGGGGHRPHPSHLPLPAVLGPATALGHRPPHLRVGHEPDHKALLLHRRAGEATRAPAPAHPPRHPLIHISHSV